MSAPTADTPLAFRRPSGVRTVKNSLATIFVTVATLITIIPLAWVLTTVIVKGYRLLLSSNWWLQSQRGSPRDARVAAPTTPSSVPSRWP